MALTIRPAFSGVMAKVALSPAEQLASAKASNDVILRLSDVSKIFDRQGTPLLALDNVSLDIERGAFHGIVGTSGAGKSTLLRLINLLETPSSGAISFNGHDLGALNAKGQREYLSKVSTIFQHFNLFHSKTVLENITFPLAIRGVPKQARLAQGLALIESVGLSGREDHYPSQLSGGQKQRVGIARALITRPEVLICDEATSALDTQTTTTILDLLMNLKQQYRFTVILITHAWDVVRHCCTFATLMENGRITESGTLRQVIRKNHSVLKEHLLPLSAGPVSQQSDPRIFDLIFDQPEQQTGLLSRIATRLNLEFSILSGRIDRFGDEDIGRFKVRFDSRSGDGIVNVALLRKALSDYLSPINQPRDAL